MPVKTIKPWQFQHIAQHHKMQTPLDMATATGLSLSKVYVICKKERWKFKSSKEDRKLRKVTFDFTRKNSAFQPDPPTKMVRPPAIYSNSSPYGIAKELHN